MQFIRTRTRLLHNRTNKHANTAYRGKHHVVLLLRHVVLRFRARHRRYAQFLWGDACTGEATS